MVFRQRTQLKCVDALLSYAERETRRERRQLNKTSTISASNKDDDTSASFQYTFPAQTPDTSWQHAFQMLTEMVKAQDAKITQLLDQGRGETSRIRLSTSDFIQAEPVANSPRLSDTSSNALLSNVAPAHAVTLLASQIPAFSGLEEENVELWIRRVELAANVHGVSDNITLLACTSKLQKYARDWFDYETSPDSISWISFKEAIIKRFRRKVLFHVAMQKIEARRWNFPKESFQEYANHKLKLMHSLQLPEQDKIQLLINGINNMSMRGMATMLKANSINEFLEDMFQLVSSCGVPHKRNSPPPTRKDKVKDSPASPKNTNQQLCHVRDKISTHVTHI